MQPHGMRGKFKDKYRRKKGMYPPRASSSRDTSTTAPSVTCLVCRCRVSRYVAPPGCPVEHAYCVDCASKLMESTQLGPGRHRVLRCCYCSTESVLGVGETLEDWCRNSRSIRSSGHQLQIPRLLELAEEHAQPEATLYCVCHPMEPMCYFNTAENTLACRLCVGQRRSGVSSRTMADFVPLQQGVCVAREQWQRMMDLARARVQECVGEQKVLEEHIASRRSSWTDSVSFIRFQLEELCHIIESHKELAASKLSGLEESRRQNLEAQANSLRKRHEDFEEAVQLQTQFETLCHTSPLLALQLYETLFDRLDTLSRVSLPSGSPSHQQAGRDFDLLLDHLSDSICAARELCRQFFTAALTGETPTLSEEPLLLETTSSEELVDGSVLW